MILGDFNVEAEKKVMKDFLYELSLFRIEGGRGGWGGDGEFFPCSFYKRRN